MERAVGWLPFMALLLGAGVLGAIRESRAGGLMTWAPTYRSALRASRRTREPVLLAFQSASGGWSAKMDAETFADVGVENLSTRFQCVRLERALDTKTARSYHVTVWPTTILLTSHGSPAYRFTGYTPASALLPAMQHLLARD
ncbi:MAG: DUF255 domain-containing protein [Armatimonadetes bacterium]|nr:DUF255 domain-containing protein [Armatimonadota bacterium]